MNAARSSWRWPGLVASVRPPNDATDRVLLLLVATLLDVRGRAAVALRLDEEGQDDGEHSSNHQDPAEGVVVDETQVDLEGEREDRTEDDQQHSKSDSQRGLLSGNRCDNGRPRVRSPPLEHATEAGL